MTALVGARKHVGVLDKAGLVTLEKVGCGRACKLAASRLEEDPI
jgi:hypothetical protein